METKTAFVRNGVLVLILVFSAAGLAYGQQISNEIPHAPESKDKVFKIEGHLLEMIKNKISEEQFNKVQKEIEGKELSKSQLLDILEELEVNDEDVEAILQEAGEHLKFTEKIKTIAPIAISMGKIETEIEKKKKELKTAQSDDVKSNILQKINELQSQMQRDGHRIKEISRDINEGRLGELSDILKLLGYKTEELDTISIHLRTQVDLMKIINTMDSIIESIEKNRKEIEKLEIQQKKAQTNEEKAQISEDLKKLTDRLKSLNNDFTVVVTGIDMDKLYQKQEKETDWEKELQEVFSPLIVQLKQVTERPRQMEMLRSLIAHYENRVPQIKEAVKSIDKLGDDVTKEKTYKQLMKLEEFWKQQEKEFTSKLQAARHQLFELEKEKMSFTETMEYLFESVFKQRGKNILYAIVAFLMTFLIFQLLRILILKINPLQRDPRFMLFGNLIDVLLYVLSFLAATTAMVIVLYVFGNWLVLGIIVIILLGILWATRNTLPQFVEQIKLLLGFGPVRQGERVIYDGIAYRVELIGIYCHLINPLLAGGTLRLPLKDLIEMRSRPYDETERWFPCKTGDWIVLNGTSHRQVKHQTPQNVVITIFDMEDNMKTGNFMSQTIRNLSASPFFWAGITVYISYKHRNQVDKITKDLTETLDAELKQLFGDNLMLPFVQLSKLTDSSMGFWMWAQMKPEVASEWGLLMGVHIPQAALKACNENGWELIRYTHVDLNQPEPSNLLKKDNNAESK